MWFGEEFNEDIFSEKIKEKLKERDNEKSYYWSDIFAYSVSKKDNPTIQEAAHFECRRRMIEWDMKVQLFYEKKLKCQPCDNQARPPKNKLLELIMTQQIWGPVLSERRRSRDQKTSFLIVSDDLFYNHVGAASLRFREFNVFTAIVEGMIPQLMFR